MQSAHRLLNQCVKTGLRANRQFLNSARKCLTSSSSPNLKQSQDEFQLLATHPDFYFGVFVKWCWWPRKLHFRNGVEFFCSRRFLLCFFKLVQLRINTACVSADVDSCMNSFRWFAKLERAATSVARSTTLRINGGCRATLDGNEGGNDRFSCIDIVSFYSIAKIFCEYKKWCWKIIINTI